MKIVRFILFAFLLSPFSPFIKNAWAVEASTDLVKVFCAEIASKNNFDLGALASNDKQWKELARKLETRELPEDFSQYRFETAEFKGCIQNYRSDFELGEFVLKGKKFLESSTTTFKQNQRSSAMIKTALIERDFRLPLIGNIILNPGQSFEDKDSLKAGKGLDERQARYVKLWENFLGGLRKKLSSDGTTFQLVKVIE